MQLTAENVNKLMIHALPANKELDEAQRKTLTGGGEVPGYVVTQGVMGHFCFNKSRLEEKREDLVSMLKELDDKFFVGKGEGYSFLNACMTKNGRQWGEHRNIDELICLGIGLGLVKFCMPREMWKVMPGGMPYFQIVA